MGLQTIPQQILANHARIGSAVWELVAIMEGVESINKIAARLGTNRRTVSRNIGKLMACGILEREPTKGHRFKYRVNF